jgi:hypothetical protein
MAQIELERKSRPVWPWVVALLVLLLLGWLVWNTLLREPSDTEVVMTPVDVETDGMVMQPAQPAEEIAGATGGAVARFARTCGAEPESRSTEEGPDFELACIREMTNALAGLVLADTTGADRLDDALRELRRGVQEAERDRLTVDSDPQRFGEIAGAAADLAADLQTTRPAGARAAGEDVERARSAASSLRASSGGADARRIAAEFFSASANVLRALDRS